MDLLKTNLNPAMHQFGYETECRWIAACRIARLTDETSPQVCFGIEAVLRVTYDPRYALCAMQLAAKLIAGLRLRDMAKFAFDDIEEAFEFVNASPDGEHRAVICKDTGKILVQSDIADIDEIGDADENSEDCVEVPDKKDLDLGQPLVWAFVEDRIPNEYNRIRAMFRRSGAYRRFKDFLEERDLLEAWYEFESQCQGKALREWCRDNGIELSD